MPSTISFSDKEWEIIYSVCDILLIPFKLVYYADKTIYKIIRYGTN